MSANPTNAWLRAHKKGELIDIAESVGLKNYESLKKTDLEVALDEFIAEHSSRLASRADLADYFKSRSKALGSPIKKERESVKEDLEKPLKVAKRRVAKVTAAAAAALEDPTSESDERGASAAALARTPARSLSQVAARIPLPATPADVANAFDRSTVAVRERVTSLYQDTGITEASNATRETLSTVTSILFVISAFELYHIRAEILADRYAFTIPAIDLVGTSDYPVYLPDMFLLLTSSFWSPALTWALTSVLLPSLAGYFFNLSASSSQQQHPGAGGPPARGTRSATRSVAHDDAVVDPLTFSIAKALVSFLVYGQGVTLGGLLSETSIARLNAAVYGGHKGILVGAAITGITSIYEAVLRR